MTTIVAIPKMTKKEEKWAAKTHWMTGEQRGWWLWRKWHGRCKCGWTAEGPVNSGLLSWTAEGPVNSGLLSYSGHDMIVDMMTLHVKGQLANYRKVKKWNRTHKGSAKMLRPDQVRQ